MPDAKKNAPYYNCFSRVVMGLAEFGYKKGPKKKTKFIFDRNDKIEFNSIYMANYLSQLSKYEWSSYIEEVGFGSNDMVEIQVADLFAHETFKYYDNQLDPIKRKMRKSLEALINTKRFKIRYQDFDYFKEISEILVTLEKDDPLWREEYHKWLLEHGLKDNDSNRIKYLEIMREK